MSISDSDFNLLIEAGLNMLGQNCCKVINSVHDPLSENTEIRLVCRANPAQHSNRSILIVGGRISIKHGEVAEELKRLILEAKPR